MRVQPPQPLAICGTMRSHWAMKYDTSGGGDGTCLLHRSWLSDTYQEHASCVQRIVRAHGAGLSVPRTIRLKYHQVTSGFRPFVDNTVSPPPFGSDYSCSQATAASPDVSNSAETTHSISSSLDQMHNLHSDYQCPRFSHSICF